MSALPAPVAAIVRAAGKLSPRQLSHRLPPPPDSARQSAVLVLLASSARGANVASATGAEGVDLLLIERAHNLRSHPGQLAFPGGGADAGEGPEQTALREAREEIGLDPAGVDVLVELPALWLPPSNFAVTCVLAWWRVESPVGVVDSTEVADVLRVPVAELVDPRRRVTVEHPTGYRGPGFLLGDLVLWGFTAGVVDRLLQHSGLAQPWDGSRTVPAPGLTAATTPERPGDPR
ncbi:CoA pyrophosphatase [soil metagenome]